MVKESIIENMQMQDGRQALCFGADLPLDAVYTQTRLPEVVRRALCGNVTWQQRNETSLMRFLAGPNQFPAFVLALLACGSVVQVADGQQVDLNDWLLSRDRVEPQMVLVPLEFPAMKLAAARVGLTPAGLGIVEVAAGVEIQQGVVKSLRLALSGVWSGRQWLSASALQLEGKVLTDEAIQAVAQGVQIEVDPPADHLGSAAYRRAMTGVLVRQVLEACR